jgi:DNA-binding NtrC family response regulator
VTRLGGIIAFGRGTREALTKVMRYAPARTPVVLVGATGTGKSFFAEALHQASGRTGPFVDVTAHELAPELARSALFGHTTGAFTGADRKHVGYLAQAERGTLLLDDFHLMRRSVQAMLLRALERSAYRPLGAERDVPVTCRLAFGVGEEPARLVERGRMLQDLRSRLGYMVVRLPSLAERRREIPALAQRFLGLAPEETGVLSGPSQFTPSALEALGAHHYPGNVRDLRELVREGYLHAVQAGSEVLGVEHLDESVWGVRRFDRRASREEKRRLIEWALQGAGGNMSEAARRVGAHRNTVAALRARLPCADYCCPTTRTGTPVLS